MLDISTKMTELIATLKTKGFNGVPFPDIEPERQEDWSAGYAIVQNAIADTYGFDLGDADRYFDMPQFNHDFEKMLTQHFSAEGEETIFIPSHKSIRDEDVAPDRTVIVVRRWDGADEIEVYRLVKGKTVFAEAEAEAAQ